ncbi:MAG: hypothetical protein IJ326_09850 [Lachnospiraceae bacterium]|nr:hypothetical protein [Lachnospiraceae bacterium]
MVYTCTDKTHGGWGILGVGATVDNIWVEGLSYSADVENPTGMVYATMTVGELRKSLGITASSQVTAFKIGAWNGGKIISLHIGAKSDADSIIAEIADDAVATTATIPDAAATGTGTDTASQAAQNTQKAPGLTGSYSQVFRSSGMMNIDLKNYASGFEIGDTVTISVTVESDGDFSGSLGMTTGSNYAWKQNDYEKGAGTHTFSVSGEATGDSAQLGIWYVGGSSVGVKSVSVSIDKKASNNSSTSGNYSGVKVISGPTNIKIDPSSYCSDYAEGDTVKITATLYSEEYFNGTIGMSDRNGNWKQAGTKECNGGTTTWSLTVSDSAGTAELQVWWMNGNKLAVKSISVSVVEKGKGEEADTEIPGETQTETEEIPGTMIPDESTPTESTPSGGGSSESTPSGGESEGSVPSEEESESSTASPDGVKDLLVHTFTEKQDFKFKIQDYIGGIEVGDKVTMEIRLEGDVYANGCIGCNSLPGEAWTSAYYETVDGAASAILTINVPYDSTEAQVQVWWWDGEGSLNLYLTVYEGDVKADEEEPESGESSDDSTESNATVTFTTDSASTGAADEVKPTHIVNLNDYISDLAVGDKVDVTVNMSGNTWYGGGIGVNSYDASTGGASWKQTNFESSATNEATATFTVDVPFETDNNIQIQLWWWGPGEIKMDVTAKKQETIDSPDDDIVVESPKADAIIG